MSVVERLTWDSDFFGVPIGRLDLDGVSDSELAKAEADARGQGITCLYGALDPADHQATYRAQERGWRLVDVAMTFDLKPDEVGNYPATDARVRLGGPADLPHVEEAVVAMAAWSRFAVDPRFGIDAARQMHLAWIDRAARDHTGEHELVVAEDDSGILAFISRARTPVPTVNTVGTTAPRSGAAPALMKASRNWAGDAPLWAGPIAARNVASLRYVEHCGCRVASVRYRYHRWLDEDHG